jgi:hypothetical protein
LLGRAAGNNTDNVLTCKRVSTVVCIGRRQQKGQLPHASCVRACVHLHVPFEPGPGTVQGVARYSYISFARPMIRETALLINIAGVTSSLALIKTRRRSSAQPSPRLAAPLTLCKVCCARESPAHDADAAIAQLETPPGKIRNYPRPRVTLANPPILIHARCVGQGEMRAKTRRAPLSSKMCHSSPKDND